MKKYPIPEIGTKFGDWVVIDNSEEYIDRDSQSYSKGILVRCSHGERRVPKSVLYAGHSKGCIECRAERMFKGCGDLAGSYLNSIQIGAALRNFDYSVTPEYLWTLFMQQNGRCALSGVDITLDPKHSVHFREKKHTQTASLDRIDNNKGYVEGNVQWVHKDINSMKGDLNQDQFVHLCELISEVVKDTPRVKIFAKLSIEGIHRWKECPIEEVDYLKNYHRHQFNIIAYTYVGHKDREIEFIQLAHNIKTYLNERYFDSKYNCCFFDDRSCEMLADELVKRFDLFEVEVNEDGEGGSIVRNY